MRTDSAEADLTARRHVVRNCIAIDKAGDDIPIDLQLAEAALLDEGDVIRSAHFRTGVRPLAYENKSGITSPVGDVRMHAFVIVATERDVVGADRRVTTRVVLEKTYAFADARDGVLALQPAHSNEGQHETVLVFREEVILDTDVVGKIVFVERLHTDAALPRAAAIQS